MLSIITFALLLVLLAAVGWLLVSQRQHREADSAEDLRALVDNLKSELVSKQMEGLLALRESLDSASRGLNERLAEGTSSMDRRLGVIGEIENKLGQLQRQTKELEELGRNIAQLSDLLKPPKVRGGVGEIFLENLLSQILPPALYETQYGFPGGQRVDAVIRLGDRLMPVDSKFPLEAFQRIGEGEGAAAAIKEYRRAIKGQVDAIAAKYIVPDQQTTDFAVMYIPAEAVYYRLVTEEESDLFAYALSQRVIPSSPGHLYAFLASVAAVYAEAGLSGNTRRLSAVVHGLTECLSSLEQIHERMGGSHRMLGQNLEKAHGQTQQMQQHLASLKEPGPGYSTAPDGRDS